MKNSNLSDHEIEANDDRRYSVTSGNDLYAEKVVSFSDSESYLKRSNASRYIWQTGRREIIIATQHEKQIQDYCFVATKGY